MKIDFALPEDGRRHDMCINCHADGVKKVVEEGKQSFICEICGYKSDRRLVIDPLLVWWIDKETKEYWHESVGVFLRNKENKFLFFERLIFPWGTSILAGHVEGKETPEEAIYKEILEELGIEVPNLKLVTQEDLIGDKCSMAADNHRWSLFLGELNSLDAINLNDENRKPVWLSLEDVLMKDPIHFPTKYFIEKDSNQLLT